MVYLQSALPRFSLDGEKPIASSALGLNFRVREKPPATAVLTDIMFDRIKHNAGLFWVRRSSQFERNAFKRNNKRFRTRPRVARIAPLASARFFSRSGRNE